MKYHPSQDINIWRIHIRMQIDWLYRHEPRSTKYSINSNETTMEHTNHTSQEPLHDKSSKELSTSHTSYEDNKNK